MKTITEIRPQQRKEDRFNIYLDGTYAFSLHLALAATLKVGQQLSEADCQHLQHQDSVYHLYEQALRYLSFRPRSRAELERHLRSKGAADVGIQEVLAKLEDAGWLNDVSFSRFWVENREDFKPRSQRALRAELRQKGVDSQIIEQAVQDLDEPASAYRAGWGRAQRLANLDYQSFQRRLGGFLLRRGFSYAIVKETVEQLWNEFAGAHGEQGSRRNGISGEQGSHADDDRTNLGPSTQDPIY